MFRGQKEENPRAERRSHQTVHLFTQKTLNDAYAPRVILSAKNTAVDKAIKYHFPHSLHPVKTSKLNGLLADDKSYGKIKLCATVGE